MVWPSLPTPPHLTWILTIAPAVRSPCPGLNSLANHGILPRNGRNYTLPLLVAGLGSGLSVGADFATVIGQFGSLANPDSDPLNPSFSLDQLSAHNFPIEHDASLSRADATFGDNHSFNQTYWNMILAYVPEGQPFTIPTAARAKYNRVMQSKAVDPNFVYTPLQFTLSYGETGLYLSTMGDPVTGIAPYEYVQYLFGKPCRLLIWRYFVADDFAQRRRSFHTKSAGAQLSSLPLLLRSASWPLSSTLLAERPSQKDSS
jgi:hypothetical protein